MRYGTRLIGNVRETGLRISELCGLTRSDIDFKSHAIHINYQLLKDSYYIIEPKTKSGFRNVPIMSEEIEKDLKRVMKRKQNSTFKEIDDDRNFLFFSPDGYPMQESCYKSVLDGIVKKYNKSHEKTPLPRICISVKGRSKQRNTKSNRMIYNDLYNVSRRKYV